ncbi:hypothetical protein GCM10011487_60940 [Steroidobacter agaridevorans]|uniref:Uncharacterized protein n=1 Tax=Steroidobacter agaridevorans TaxID=2695856 RepID=A0A829YKZ0_9GAMM|nr:hypothetical protein [Steroidobacter agaridevorans]GFE84094.1 hypothetical protein GCM10011487_60940 [Steroidobacter agaridevorans]GFE86914.1 hypothetical protein GCM10011488_18680 [Steroidobacter agaridevorans]
MSDVPVASVDAFIGHILRGLSPVQQTLMLRLLDATDTAQRNTIVQNANPGDLGELFQRNFVGRDIDNPNKLNVQIQNMLLAWRQRNPQWQAATS